LLGSYRTPRFRYGKAVCCEARGEVTICGLTDAPIRWPVGKRGRAKSLVLYADLARAVRRESAQAVAHWWGVGLTAVWKWRKALGVGPATEGTSRLHREGARDLAVARGLKKAQAKAGDPARRAKIAAALRGKPKPAHVGRAVAKAHRGTRHTEEARAKMSATHKRRGTLVPGTRVWTPKEDALVRRLPRNEAARRTGRTPAAVSKRRAALGLPDGRRR
jgi:hypothetical protein